MNRSNKSICFFSWLSFLCHWVTGWLPLKFCLVRRHQLCRANMSYCLYFSDLHLSPRLSQFQHISWAYPCGWGGLFPGGRGWGSMAIWLRHFAPGGMVLLSIMCVAQGGSLAESQAASHLWKHPLALSQLRASLPDLYCLLCFVHTMNFQTGKPAF